MSLADGESRGDGHVTQMAFFEFPEPEEALEMSTPCERARPRLRRADRKQVEWRPVALDALLPEDHPARVVWTYVGGLDLGPLHEPIAAVEGHAGRPVADPRILMSLWLYATVDGVGSARQLDRLCREHLAYMWICGGVSMNYHTLSDFRTAHVEFLDGLLTDSVAALLHQGVVTLDRVAQDGMRVRASAGTSSFRREESLGRCLAEAEARVGALREELAADPGAASRRQEAARQRAARERLERVRKALEELPKVGAARRARNSPSKRKPRASTTDAQARVMKMPGGGFRPAFNVQFATATESQIIVGAGVTNAGSDGGQLAPMAEQIATRYGRLPKEMLADGDFAKLEDIDTLSAPPREVTVYAPVRETKNAKVPPHTPRPGDSEAVAAWRVRMGTPEAKEVYKERAATAECVNADARNHGLYRFLVRGLPKVCAVVLWHVLAHNFQRIVRLCPATVGLE